MRHYNKILLTGLTALAALGFSACSDDWIGGNGLARDSFNSDTQLVLELALPVQHEETRSNMSLEGTEGKVNDLRLIAFGKEGTSAVVNRALPASDLSSLTNDKGLTVFEVAGMAAGKYKIYIVANMGESLSGISDETTLRGIINNYKTNLPAPGNLPMVYESGALISVQPRGENPEIIETSLKIAAVKVKYNIIFDKKNAGAVFGDNGLKIKSVTVSHAAAESYLIENTSTDNKLAERNVTPSSVYHNSYTDTPANANADNKDVITFTESASAAPSSYAGTWVCSGTIYLPERYAKDNADKTSMDIEAVVTDKNGAEGSVKCSYSINLGGYKDHEDEVSMPRDTYYEVIGRVTSLGSAKLDSYTVIKSWTPTITQAVFSGTYLNLGKTTAMVTSLNDDEINYSSDASGKPQFVCDTKINGVSAILGSLTENNSIKLMVNPEVSIDNLPNDHGEGVATCWILSGNIRKQILVDYDITPFFIITPQETKVQWSDNDQLIRTKEYSYRTNLGGLMVTSNKDDGKGTVLINGSTKTYVSEVGKSKLEISCVNPQSAMGTLKVTATSNPQTTTVHEFDAYPAKAQTVTKYVSLKQDLRVTVMPPLGGYRIYFRAVNDWHKFDGGEGNISGEWLEGKSSWNDDYYPKEDYTTVSDNATCRNWIDYWYCVSRENGNSAWDNRAGYSEGGGYKPFNDSHRIYIWTQTGERVGVDDNPPVWRFTDPYTTAPQMRGDYTNPGWYYYDLSATAYQSGTSGDTKGVNKIPEPGTTLMIFHNLTNAGKYGFTVHRVPGHLEPGVPLFDYEDREGWVLYDPTTDGLYRVFDEKPYIEDVKYVIYSDVKPTGWWRKYGIATKQPSGSSFPQYTIYSNNVDNVTTETINGKTYYRYEIRLKAPRGYHAKAININFSMSGGTTTSTSQRVWYYSKNGWENPRVYIYNDNGGSYKAWGSTDAMIKDRTEGGGTYYYYDIPSDYKYGRVIFQNNDRTQQHPGKDQAGLQLNGNSMVYYADSGSWAVYSGSSSSTASTYSSKLFGGRSFAGDTGYFNSVTKAWTVGKPQ